MNARTTRRSFLGALIGGVALLGIERGNNVLARDSMRPSHTSKAEFKSSCDQYGGTFIDSPKDKLTVCVWSDGGKTVCDGNGADCINFPPPKKAPGSGQGPWGDIPTGEITEFPEFENAGPADERPTSGGGKSKRRGKRRKK